LQALQRSFEFIDSTLGKAPAHSHE
jgi:hypothetical protein